MLYCTFSKTSLLPLLEPVIMGDISLPVEVASGNLVLLVSLPNLYVGVLMWFCVYSHYKELVGQGHNHEVWCEL